MSEISLAEEHADSIAGRWCFEQYSEELGRRFDYVVDSALALGLDELTPPAGLVLIAREDGEPDGCGAVKLGQPEIAEVKRMWVTQRVRGQGLGGRLLDALEARAIASGKSVARLETNRTLVAAIAMYRGHGYREVPAFNMRFGDHWFERDLTRGAAR